MPHEYNFMATGIGSLPHTDPDAAVALALRWLPEAPIWPQLPRRGFREHMVAQYLEALPGLVAGEKGFFVDAARDLTAELERFYERYLEGDLGHFAISEQHAAGFHALVRALGPGPPDGVRFLKGHVTGPLTAGVTLKDEAGRDVIHNETVYDALVKNLSMKAAWQVERLSAFGKPVIVFIDEPALESLGSAFSAVAPEAVAERIREVADAIRARGGIPGIHCCGNADWSLVFSSGVEIVNFDAYDYLDRVLLYPEDIREFLSGGGALAWGIVPTGLSAGAATAAELAERLEAGLRRLGAAGVPRDELVRAAIVTPSCGLGSLEPGTAEAALALTLEVSGLMRQLAGC